LDEAIGQIRQNLSNAAQVRGVQRQLLLKRESDGQILETLPDNIRVWVLQKEKWSQVYPRSMDRGQYAPEANKVILNNANWCRKTMIHESLHSVSIFSHPDNLSAFDMTYLFAEGVTEFLTGLLLWRAHRNCYENWRLGRSPQWCSIGYQRETKAFLAFCGCSNSQSLLDLYFGVHSDNFAVAWSSFIEAVRHDTGKKFRDVLPDAKKIGLFMAFRNECDKQFGKKFRKLEKLQDYSRVF